MNKLENFFKSLQKERSSLTNASSGTLFEENLANRLKKAGFTKMIKDEELYPELNSYLDEIKNIILAKTGSILLDNTLKLKNVAYTDFFVQQPYGSQNFPDFLVFTEHKIFSIESKYTGKDSKRPMWNSNLPKSDAIYIFGSYGSKNLTFFRGEYVLPEQERKYLLDFFDKTQSVMDTFIIEYQAKIKKDEISATYGFFPYIRKAFDQKRVYNENAIIDFINNPQALTIEEQTIQFIHQNDRKPSVND